MENEETEYDYKKLKEAGKVSADALKHVATVIKPGTKLSDAAESIERFIADAGCGMAFPVNLSTGAEAAHYTPEFSDQRVIGDKDVIKIDLGARKDAYLTDCAMTMALDPAHLKLVEASEKALEDAISLVKSGRSINEIGREIEKTAKSCGFNTIRNLGGHGISQEELHADIFIPNFDNGDTTPLEEGQVIAIEPFLTTGVGYVTNGESIQIFQKTGDVMPRSQDSRDVLNHITEHFSTYPFAMRWLIKGMDGNEFKARRSIADLLNAGDLEAFPVLVEKSGGIVSQAEKTLIVEKDSCAIVT
ncbi:MAG: type II methionyl aminopeptidase [Candidatus Marsarchaeota archaeon]|nr:type II methionyl aminopeptidase [Candidatus Marsarchaeota archaeon]MCL5413351.1 type II methionyl aminopeptidase [Candidatus Marsarchaeota archaeon]